MRDVSKKLRQSDRKIMFFRGLRGGKKNAGPGFGDGCSVRGIRTVFGAIRRRKKPVGRFFPACRFASDIGANGMAEFFRLPSVSFLCILFTPCASGRRLPAFFGEPRKDARMLPASCPALFPMRALTAGKGSCIINEMMLSAFELFAMDLRPAFRSFRTNALLPACMTQKLYAGERFFVIWDIRKKTFLHI